MNSNPNCHDFNLAESFSHHGSQNFPNPSQDFHPAEISQFNLINQQSHQHSSVHPKAQNLLASTNNNNNNNNLHFRESLFPQSVESPGPQHAIAHHPQVPSKDKTDISLDPQIASEQMKHHDGLPFNFAGPFSDVDNFPVTTPPIYEYDALTGSMRRRASISNGQIGQLKETFEDLENSDGEKSTPDMNPENQLTQSMANGVLYRSETQPPTGDLNMNNDFVQVVRPDNNNSITSPVHFQDSMMMPNVMMVPQPHHLPHPNAAAVSHYHQPSDATVPGSAAWKRARLLERNRVAASKCRQKKKVAQQRLQKEAANAVKESKNLRRRVEYLENTLSKVKDVMRLHMKSCNGSTVSIDILEDFLGLDEKYENRKGVKHEGSE